MSKRRTAATTIRRAAARSAGTGSVSHGHRDSGRGSAGAMPRTVGSRVTVTARSVGGGRDKCRTGFGRRSRVPGADDAERLPDAVHLGRFFGFLLFLEEGERLAGHLD